jgi:tripartite ATP-independent transporter DctP family solute receptor
MTFDDWVRFAQWPMLTRPNDCATIATVRELSQIQDQANQHARRQRFMSINRRRFVFDTGACAIAGVAVASWSGSARAADFTFKLGCNTVESHPLTVRKREAAARILKRTNGAVDVKIFPQSQLGSDTDMLSQLRSGALELLSLTPLVLSTLAPRVSINGVGFAWADYQQVWPAMDGKLGEWIRAEIRKSGLYAFEKIWDNGFRHVTSSSRQVTTPDDMNGLKIRVPASPLWTTMFKSLGSSPVTVNISEVYSALQTKIADAQENPLAIIDTLRFFEVQKFLAKTNHMWDGWWLLANNRTWSAVPADVRTIVETEFNASCIQEREDIAKLNNSLEATLTSKGMKINTVQASAFRAKLQASGFYKEWRGKYGEEGWKLLESYAGAIS